MSETKKLADFAANLSFDDIPKDVVERIKFLVMDTVGISIRAMHDAESTPALLLPAKPWAILEVKAGSWEAAPHTPHLQQP